MLVQKKISNFKKTILIIVSLLIIGVIAYLIYDNFLSYQIGAQNQSWPTKIKPLTLPKIEPLLDTDFFHLNPYLNLQQKTALPLRVENLGRPDPFSKINASAPNL